MDEGQLWSILLSGNPTPGLSLHWDHIRNQIHENQLYLPRAGVFNVLFRAKGVCVVGYVLERGNVISYAVLMPNSFFGNLSDPVATPDWVLFGTIGVWTHPKFRQQGNAYKAFENLSNGISHILSPTQRQNLVVGCENRIIRLARRKFNAITVIPRYGVHREEIK